MKRTILRLSATNEKMQEKKRDSGKEAEGMQKRAGGNSHSSQNKSTSN